MSIVWRVLRCPDNGGLLDSRVVGHRDDLPLPARSLAWAPRMVWTGDHGGSWWRVESMSVEPSPSSPVLQRLKAAVRERRWAKAHRVVNREATRSGAAAVVAWAQAIHADLRWARGAADRYALKATLDGLVPPPNAPTPSRAVPKAERKRHRRQRVACDAVRRAYPEFEGVSDAAVWDYLMRP